MPYLQHLGLDGGEGGGEGEGGGGGSIVGEMTTSNETTPLQYQGQERVPSSNIPCTSPVIHHAMTRKGGDVIGGVTKKLFHNSAQSQPCADPLGKIQTTVPITSLVPRPSPAPVFDRLQYAKTESAQKLEPGKAWERG